MPVVELKVGAKLETVSAREMREELDRFRKNLVPALLSRPLLRDVPTDGVADANGLLDLKLGSPAAGDMWDVRRLVIVGPDPSAVVNVTSVVTYTQNPGEPYSVADRATSLPQVAFYGTDQVPVRTGEVLTIRCSGLAPAQHLFATALFVQRDKPSEEPSVRREHH